MESILIICGNYFCELSFDYNKGVAKTKFSLTTPNHQNSNTCVVMSLRSVSQSFDSVIRGHHIYKEVWSPVIGEILTCEEEPGNVNDLFAVAIKRSGIVVGHIPRTISSVCCLFLRRGTISCEVIGHRQYSLDLPQGGLDVPCRLTFTGMIDHALIFRGFLILRFGPQREIREIYYQQNITPIRYTIY